jgi:hypothetical protein
LPAQRLLGDADPEFRPDPLAQIDQSPAHDAINRRGRVAFVLGCRVDSAHVQSPRDRRAGTSPLCMFSGPVSVKARGVLAEPRNGGAAAAVTYDDASSSPADSGCFPRTARPRSGEPPAPHARWVKVHGRTYHRVPTAND